MLLTAPPARFALPPEWTVGDAGGLVGVASRIRTAGTVRPIVN